MFVWKREAFLVYIKVAKDLNCWLQTRVFWAHFGKTYEYICISRALGREDVCGRVRLYVCMYVGLREIKYIDKALRIEFYTKVYANFDYCWLLFTYRLERES